MNKTININLAGIIFHVDEDAYNKLSAYLEKIKLAFSHSEGKDEIIADIEARIAELFQSKLSDKKEVVSMADVDEVIEVMGKPEDYIDEEAGENTDDYTSYATGDSKIKKRIFRNPDDKVLGGICGGLGEYLEIDPLWLRLGFGISFFFFGTGFLLYIALWAIIPEASTTAEKLQMKGERINVSNIEKSIKEEIDNVQEKLKDFSKKQVPKGKNAIEKFFDLIGNLITLIFKLVTRIIGFAFIVAGVLAAIFLFTNLGGGLPDVLYNMVANGANVNITEILDIIFVSNLHTNLTLIGATLFIIIPATSIIIYGIRLLFDIKPLGHSMRVSLGSLWGVSWILLIISTIWLLRDFRYSDGVTITEEIEPIESDVYYINVNKNSLSDIVDESELFYLDFTEEAIYMDGVELDIHKSSSGMYLDITSDSQGGTRFAAKDKAENIKYNFEQQDSLLLFNDYYQFPKKDKLRAQDTELNLYIPVGTKVFLNRDMRGIIYGIKNVTNMWDRDMVGHLWEMTDKGFECLDCEVEKEEEIETDESNFFDE